MWYAVADIQVLAIKPENKTLTNFTDVKLTYLGNSRLRSRYYILRGIVVFCCFTKTKVCHFSGLLAIKVLLLDNLKNIG